MMPTYFRFRNTHWLTYLLTVEDCIDLGRLAYDKGDFYHTVMWMEHALQQLELRKQNISHNYHNRTQAIVLDYLSFATFKVSVNNVIYRISLKTKKQLS